MYVDIKIVYDTKLQQWWIHAGFIEYFVIYCDLIFIDDSCWNIPKYPLWKMQSQLRLANSTLNEPCPYDIRTPQNQRSYIHELYSIDNSKIYEMIVI